MKKLFVILLFMSFLSNAQNHFKALEQKESINKTVVDSKMLEIMSNLETDSNNSESKEYQKLVKSISSLKIFVDENGKHKSEMLNLFQTYINKHNLKEKKVNNNKLMCYTKKGSSIDKISDLLLLTENVNNLNESILVFVKGDFKLKQADLLIKKLKIPGVKQISSF